MALRVEDICYWPFTKVCCSLSQLSVRKTASGPRRWLSGYSVCSTSVKNWILLPVPILTECRGVFLESQSQRDGDRRMAGAH